MEDHNIVRFFECLIPVTVCNLKCSYCYVIQRNYRNMKIAQMKYSPKQIGNALTMKRLGGRCFFSICGAGETMAQPEIVDIVSEILSQGHIVNITSNGTLTNKFLNMMDAISPDQKKSLHFSFSFHYVELLKHNLLEVFFDNVELVKKNGCSIMVQLNLCDEYIPYIQEIKEVCLQRIGALPQIAATRKEDSFTKIELYTDLTREEYVKIGRGFQSALFDYTMENFNVKRKEFCYAGDRSGVLDLSTGCLRKCYGDPAPQYIFDNPETPIKFEAIGRHCLSHFCLNSSHFMSLGVIDNDDKRTYCSLRDRPEANWFNNYTKNALSKKVVGSQDSYSNLRKAYIDLKMTPISVYKRLWRYLSSVKRKMRK